MKIVLINLSPRMNGTSAVLVNTCADFLESKKQEIEKFDLYKYLTDMSCILESINKSDTIVFSGPTYLNCYPADTLRLLQNIADRKEIIHFQNVYSMIQGGMPYVHTHIYGTKTIEFFCKEYGLSYKGSFVIGLGAFLNGKTIDAHPNARKLKKNFKKFLNHLYLGEYSPDSLFEESEIKVPQIFINLLAVSMNRNIKKDLIKHGIDPDQRSPYM